uniref:Uncharacterized protein n=1 Tax=Lepeophtheirus salmonis TaxID=72036 RepID=A0A0K2V5H1_LEPSM
MFSMPAMIAYKEKENLKDILCRGKVFSETPIRSSRTVNKVGLKKCLENGCRRTSSYVLGCYTEIVLCDYMQFYTLGLCYRLYKMLKAICRPNQKKVKRSDT